ncbi:MAG TPA: tail fiber domain-containing protein [Thermoanaerobaculia bacterium]|jgi:hypothetical protein|nr:tail fiber domain-containing protein [Thermoanaerobaculia bacterium]
MTKKLAFRWILLLLWTGLCTPAFLSAQEVIADTLIVQGDLCAGTDCSATESFGLDILKIKHNNTHLLFDDSSTTAGFPATDWRLTANDSTNGGVNRFSIEDVTAATVPVTIRGAAPTNSFFVSNIGRVGLGTATPDARLDVEAASSPEMRLTTTGGDAWRLLNDSQGFSFILSGAAFRASVLDVDGNLTIHGMLTEGSSRDIKTDFETLDPRTALDRVLTMPVSLWSYKTESPGIRHLGPMAQDFHQAFGLGADNRHIAPGDQAGVAFLALQGMNQVIAEKDRQVADLAARVAKLEGMIEALAGKEAGGPR